MTAPRRSALAAWAPLLVALAVRLAALPWGAEIPHTGDAASYVAMAREFAASGRFIETNVGVRPPLFRVLVALGLDMDTLPFDPWPGSYLALVACDLVTCLTLMVLGARLFGRRAGLATGWLYALFPTTALYSTLLVMAEGPTLMLLSLTLLVLLQVERRLGQSDGPTARGLRGPLLGAGVLLGLGILTKEVMLPVTGLLALGVGWSVARVRGLRPGLGAGGLLLGTALLVTAPWTVSLYQRHGILVVSSTATDLVLMHGNMPAAAGGGAVDGMRRWSEGGSLPERVRMARRTFRRAWLEDTALTLRRAFTRLRIVLGPEVIMPAWIGHWLEDLPITAREGYGFQVESWRRPAGSWARTVQVADALATALVAGLAAAGLLRHGRRLHGRLALIVLVGLVLAYMITWAESRYRITFLPLLLPFAGVALAGSSAPDAPGDDPGRRAERLGLAVGLALLTSTLLLPAPPIP